MRRTRLEIYSALLNQAKKGDCKYNLFKSSKMILKDFDESLNLLTHVNLLSADTSLCKVCKNGQIRKIIYKTTEKGIQLIHELEELKQLVSKP